MKHLALCLLAPLALTAACGDTDTASEVDTSSDVDTTSDADTPASAPVTEPAVEAPAEPAPEPEPTVDPVVGTWAIDGAASWEANRVALTEMLDGMLAGAGPEERAMAEEGMKAGFTEQEVEIVLAADGSVDSRFRTDATSEWDAAVGEWTQDDTGVVTITTWETDASGEANTETEPEVQDVTIDGDRMTVAMDQGGPVMTMIFVRR